MVCKENESDLFIPFLFALYVPLFLFVGGLQKNGDSPILQLLYLEWSGSSLDSSTPLLLGIPRMA